jgi:hypothetical protein
MKKSMFIAMLLIFVIPLISAQKFDLRIQAGANVTFMPDFENTLAILNDGLAVPGVISVANSRVPIMVIEPTSLTQPGFGFGAGVDSRYSMQKGWKLYFSLGFNMMKYDYDTYIDEEGTPNLWLSEYTPQYGNTSFYYINLKPVNISKDFLEGRLSLTAGATFNFNVYSKYFNILVIYSDEAIAAGRIDGIERLYFESTGSASLLLAGVHGKMDCRIIGDLYGFASYEYFFNSVYQKKTSFGDLWKDTNPSQLHLGLSYAFWHSGK